MSARAYAIGVPAAVSLAGFALTVMAWAVLAWWAALLVCVLSVPMALLGGVICIATV